VSDSSDPKGGRWWSRNLASAAPRGNPSGCLNNAGQKQKRGIPPNRRSHLKTALIARSIGSLGLVLLSGYVLSVGRQAQEKTSGKPLGLSLDLAERVGAAARAKAQNNGWGMSCAVVDLAGPPVVLTRMDKARWLNTRVAQSKAFPAVTFQRPSVEVEEMTKTRPQRWRSLTAYCWTTSLTGRGWAAANSQRGSAWWGG
jgi:uncharacterized protein GlcG (DUF336 family)